MDYGLWSMVHGLKKAYNNIPFKIIDATVK